MRNARTLELKTLLGSLQDETGPARIALGHLAADECLGGGLVPGALHEVFAATARASVAASGFALLLAARMLGEHKGLLWVCQDFSALETGEIHGNGLVELGIDPARVLMVRAPNAKAVLRAGAEGLSCRGMAAVLLEPWDAANVFDLTASQRLTLAARQRGISVIALRAGSVPEPSAAQTRWMIEAAPSPINTQEWGAPVFDAALVRNRRGETGRWRMQWDCNNGTFCEAYSCAPAAAFADRPAATAVAGIRQAG